MRKTWLLAASNLRREKGQTATFFIIILISSLLMSVGIITWRNYDTNFDKRALELNSADSMLAVQSRDKNLISAIEKRLKEDDRTKSQESRPILLSTGKFAYSSGEQTKIVVVFQESADSKINHISYMEKEEDTSGNSVYLPWLFHIGGGFEIGDKFSITLSSGLYGEKTYTYRVSGFFEETFLSVTNSSSVGIILEDSAYYALSNSLKGSIDSTLFYSQLKQPGDGEQYCTTHGDYAVQNTPTGVLIETAFYSLIKQARTYTSSIISMLIVAFSIIIVVITLIVVKFRIGNSIEEGIQNIGALKAIGYTSRQIVFSYLMQFTLMGTAGCLIGIVLSYAALPYLSDLLAAQTGVIWKQGFDAAAMFFTLFVILSSSALTSFLSTMKIRKLHPLTALRSGLNTHSFRKNILPLDRCRGNLTVLLSLKSLLQNTRQNILVILIISIISFAATFAGVLYYNITVDDEIFLNLVGGEVSDIQITPTYKKSQENLLTQIKKMPEVKKAYYTFQDFLTTETDGKQLLCYVTADFSLYNNQNMIYKGRFPSYSNEIALGGILAREIKKSVGDTIRIKKDGRMEEFLITGLIQSSNYMGRDACLTDDAYKKLSKDKWFPSINIYLKQSESTDAFQKKLEKVFSADISLILNMADLASGSLSIYTKIVKILAYCILLITIAIVALTLYLIVNTDLVHKKRELGIQKAVGMTTCQLVVKTTLSFLPVVFCGTIIGCAAGYAGINPMLGILFSNLGIMKVNFIILPSMLILFVVCITGFGFIISALVSFKIRKISPYTLITE